jgi:hypothetical protein
MDTDKKIQDLYFPIGIDLIFICGDKLFSEKKSDGTRKGGRERFQKGTAPTQTRVRLPLRHRRWNAAQAVAATGPGWLGEA